MPIGPAVEPKLLRLGAHGFVSDLRHVDPAGLVVKAPHAFFFQCQFFGVAGQDHGLQKKPAVVGNLIFVVQAFFHRPVVLPAVGEMDVVHRLASNLVHERALHFCQLIAAKRVTIIVQPLAPGLDGAQTNFADDPHRTGCKGE